MSPVPVSVVVTTVAFGSLGLWLLGVGAPVAATCCTVAVGVVWGRRARA